MTSTGKRPNSDVGRPSKPAPGRSGKLQALNDLAIMALLDDPLYDVREDGTIWTLRTPTGKVGLAGLWRRPLSTLRAANPSDPYIRLRWLGRRLAVHRIVYAKLNGPLEADLVINHIDGDPTNNIPSNLELVSHQENIDAKFSTL